MKILLIGGCGYIGSLLFQKLSLKYDVDTLDLEWFENTSNLANLKHDFAHLTQKDLDKYDHVILLAGHSSVPMCKDNPISAFNNNVVNFIHLLDNLKDQKFIYASSSSVYGITKGVAATEEWKEFSPHTHYDLTKQEIDFYARLSGKNYYGLRFGTVNGYSPNLRIDIMINKMFFSAMINNQIDVFNKDIYRPILGIEDLCRAIEAILDGEDRPGIYNLASFNSTVNEIATEISTAVGVPVIDKGSTPAYNFSIDTTKFQTLYNFEFKETVASIVKSLKENWQGLTLTHRSETVIYKDPRRISL
jgi:nucleoside-diphosphate-sugar epimerase